MQQIREKNTWHWPDSFDNCDWQTLIKVFTHTQFLHPASSVWCNFSRVSAIVICTILAKFTCFENVKWKIILQVYMKSLYLKKIDNFCEI